MSYIVELNSVTKKYGKIKAVDNIDLKVREGEFFSLLGPSGCGKTTTLRIIGGFIEQDSGNVKIDNTLMKNIPPNKRNTSMVFQNLALFPHLDVKENIIYGLRKKHFSKNMISGELEKILALVNLKGLETRKITELSGGQQQRVALARSLIIKPRILLLDEPLSSLDKKLRIAMREELKQIQKKSNTTFLYVTHDQSEALTMSDTISVMKDGKIIQTGSPGHIYNYPANIFTADFIGAGNFIEIKEQKPEKGYIILKTSRNGIIKFRNKSWKNNINIQKTYFFIRPEKIRVNNTSGAGCNFYKGTIKTITFEGPDIRMVVSHKGLGEITVEIKNDSNIKTFKEGQEISVFWNYEEGIILQN